MHWLSILMVIGGLAILVAGGELLVRGASALAVKAGVSPLVIGLTVVSAATSAPELAVTAGAVLNDQTDLAVGNVVGSNIANILLILGFTALVLPLGVRLQLIKLDVPFLTVLSLVLLLVAADGTISASDGAVMFGLLIVHVVWTIRASNAGKHPSDALSTSSEQTVAANLNVLSALGLVVVGVGLLVGGAQLLVTGAVDIATALGVSGLVIGLTVVAIGTSLPELVSSVVAVRKGEGDIAVGNAVGSCLANIGLVLGVPAMLSPSGITVPDAAVALDIPLMIATTAILLPMAFTGLLLDRWEAIVLFGLYIAYTVYVVLGATNHDAQQGFSGIMLAFVLPLLGFVLLITTLWEVRKRVAQRSG